ncbi:alpha/beta hydrolase [Neogemmobacter tilapiae]|uniref:Esterase n=1 Tax=Neogemmobacter tilapiae TaxID=875041 RepID=A0A918TVJ6_9RHOB|nr:alpha/beta hydrolase-fold protein [Gemmobacter tilapiae]GHC65376.1 esterase [Gemmobacter tilapiae]
MNVKLHGEGLAGAGGTRWFDLEDRASGAVRRVFLWVPAGEAPATGWPALWLLDGNAVIGTAVDVMRSQAMWPTGTNLGWGALVAVGYPTEDAYDPFRRSWDLGPPPGASYPPFWPDTPEVRTGGGAEMARFLLEDAREFLAGHVRLDLDEQALFGHSFGGLFALWLLFTQPLAFRHWIAASPAITWEESFLLKHLDGFVVPNPAPRVHLSAGEWEGMQLAPFQTRGAEVEARLAEKGRIRTVAAMEEMAVALKAKGVVTACEIYADETHMSVLPVAVNRALHWAFDLDKE